MDIFHQILWGSAFLTLCTVVHVMAFAIGMPVVTWVGEHAEGRGWRTPGKSFAILLTALGAVIGSHTVQIWIWAFIFVHTEVIPDWNGAVYFSIVTYTTLGYGDIVLGEGLRIYATFAAIAGLLSFGISTAFLVEVFGHAGRANRRK